MSNFEGHRYFLNPEILLNSETRQELQWLWEHGEWSYRRKGSISPLLWKKEFWEFYKKKGFVYIVVDRARVGEATSVWDSDAMGARIRVSFLGERDAVLRIGV